VRASIVRVGRWDSAHPGLTKSWESADGSRWRTVREGGSSPLTYTIKWNSGGGPEWFYIGIRIGPRRWPGLYVCAHGGRF
jgi:hypothetical protein